jgi:hypothetical protein
MSNNAQIEPQVLQTTAFGALEVESRTPILQNTATYGITSKLFQYATLGGTTILEDGLFKAKCGANMFSIASSLSKDYLSYRAGQGLEANFTAQFDTPAVSNAQAAGLITETDAFAFGYNLSAEYGIIYNHDGVVEIQELTITAAATGSENATITINGTGYTVPLTNVSIQQTTTDIADSLTSQVSDYLFTANNNQVVASSRFSAPAGAFAFTSGTATAAWTQEAAGALVTPEFIAQADWNGESVGIFDPQKLNVYKIQLEYLGAGGIQFFMENSADAQWVLVHTIAYASLHNAPSVSNPSFRVGWVSQNITNTTEVEVSGASMAGFIQGIKVVTNESRSIISTNATLSATTLTNMLTIRNRQVVDGKRNRTHIDALIASAFAESTKGSRLEVIRGATLGAGNTFNYIDKTSSISEFCDTPVTVTGGSIVTSIPVSPNGQTINLKELLIDILPNETLTLAMIQNGTPPALAQVSITFVEDL